jgi:integrase/recombinase XerD
MKLSVCLHEFFDRYLPHLKGVSRDTIKTYRDTFTLFLPFVASHFSTPIDSLSLQNLSVNLIIAFLAYLERERKITPRTRNLRLATLKSFAKMTRLMYPDYKDTAESILNIPQKRTQKALIGFVTQEEILTIFKSVDMKKKEGFRDYTILNLLFDSGARATEIATLNLDYFDAQNKTLIILGKGNRYRQITLCLKTTQLMARYITRYRIIPKPIYQHRIFINQRAEEFTRFGIYRLCKNISAKC